MYEPAKVPLSVYHTKHGNSCREQVGDAMNDPAWHDRTACLFLIHIAHTPCNESRKGCNQHNFYTVNQGTEHHAMQQSE